MSHRQSGFTLIETLVALVVFALVAGAVQVCLSGGWRSVKTARMETAALRIAKVQLASAGLEKVLTDGIQFGETSDGFSWSRDVQRYSPPSRGGFEIGTLPAYWVTVSVHWRDGVLRPEREVVLRTLKLGRLP